MTNRFLRGTAGIVTTAVVGLTTAACGDFLDVRNPTIVDAATIDPVADLPTFSLSARQNFSRAYGWTSIYGAWFTGEAYVGDTFPTRNEFGLRNIDYTNGSLAGDVWNPLSLAIATNERVVELATEAGVTDQLPYKRSALFAGYSVLFMAEHFCEGAVGSGLEPGVRMSTSEMLNHAITRFEQARDGAATGDEAASITNAARVGIARAQLQLGNYGAAITAASGVPADFAFTMPYLDDPSFRVRLGNAQWYFTLLRESLVVPPAYRNMDDPRIPWNDAGRVAQDGELQFYRQAKFPGWGESVRLASGLEARYIVAEAELLGNNNPAPALLLIAERRAVGEQPAFVGVGTDAILAELMDQRSRDFWLEGKRTGDFRRNPGAVPYVPATGQTYYKPAQGAVRDNTCFPVPRVEIDNNPNF